MFGLFEMGGMRGGWIGGKEVFAIKQFESLVLSDFQELVRLPCVHILNTLCARRAKVPFRTENTLQSSIMFKSPDARILCCDSLVHCFMRTNPTLRDSHSGLRTDCN